MRFSVLLTRISKVHIQYQSVASRRVIVTFEWYLYYLPDAGGQLNGKLQNRRN